MSGTAFLPATDLPFELDPTRGWFASANQDNLPAGYAPRVGFQWSEPFRFRRICEVLETDRKFDLADLTKLQQDQLSFVSEDTGAAAVAAQARWTRERRRRSIGCRSGISYWTGKSVPASIYVTWEKGGEACPLGTDGRAKRPRESFPVRYLSTDSMIGWLTRPDGRFGPDPAAGRDALLLKGA